MNLVTEARAITALSVVKAMDLHGVRGIRCIGDNYFPKEILFGGKVNHAHLYQLDITER